MFTYPNLMLTLQCRGFTIKKCIINFVYLLIKYPVQFNKFKMKQLITGSGCIYCTS